MRTVSAIAVPTASGVAYAQPNANRELEFAGLALWSSVAVVVTFREGGATGKVLFPVALAAGESSSEPWPWAIKCSGSLYMNVESGSAASLVGSVYIA